MRLEGVMTDYSTLLHRSRHAHLPVVRSDLPAGVRPQAPGGRAGLYVPALAAGIPHPVLRGVRRDRRGLRASGSPLCRGPGDSRGSLQEGTEQGSGCSPVSRGGGSRGRGRPRRDDRNRPGEGLGVALLEGEGPGARGASPHGVGATEGLRQPLLLLPVGSRLGARVLEDERLCAVPDLAVAQRSRVGQAPAREGGDRLPGARQRLPLLCRSAGAAAHLDRLGPGAVQSFFWRWVARLPSPFPRADLRAGYVYALAFRQIEVSDTRVFDRPQAGRAWFEGVIRDHLDVGRPDQVALIFQRPITA